MSRGNPIIIVQGSQWGSEAKGAVAAFLCQTRDVHYAVRTGAVNAGHTVYDNGVEWKMQQLPVGFVNPQTSLVIGAGALIHPDILMREVTKLEEAGYDVVGRLYIDYRAGLHTEEHTDKSAASGRHHSMGATGKGCSEALIDRVRLRGSGGALFRDHPVARQFHLVDTEELLNSGYDRGERLLLEGTQGSGLDLYFGPYPYTTHKSCQAATWAQEAGLSPALDYEVVLVARTYPIRVAGNSGPMPGEIGWEHLASNINERLKSKGMEPWVSEQALGAYMAQCHLASTGTPWPLHPRLGCAFWAYSAEERVQYKEAISEFHTFVLKALPEPVVGQLRTLFELTTVTKKLRRVARFSAPMWAAAKRMNRPAYSVLTFANYVIPEVWGTTSFTQWAPESFERLDMWAHEVGVRLSDFRYVTTGPNTEHVLELSNSFRLNYSIGGFR